ncbi:YhcH/YjgK/YiaL family protein [Clostridium pasteurianum]|uniref:YhcH/YjgK/YiaL family protein n=1 Tax=Clostridium pasteurianum TaxID=1501 RepID=UPI002260A383|nr:YhcH/YjgK/YiaL family protein [Clostridium pasteurianum]UZW12998.1 YhcH/YjgK/YiaL family protein [Clostridium pasteurianum]
MIFGNIDNIDDIKKVCPKPILKAVNYLKDNDFNNMEAGVYSIMGDDIYAQVVDKITKDKQEAKAEVHRKYIEIQFSVGGNEIIGYARDTGNNIVTEELLEEKDSIFYNNVENEIDLFMNAGSFAIFFPEDVHRPWCAYNKPCKVRKINIKINRDLI